jgi:hypothetical protein
VKRRQLGIFTAIVGLVVGYAIYDYRSVLNEAKSTTEKRRLFSADPSQVQKVILKADGQTIEVERDEKGWKMNSPVKDWADGQAIEKFIEGISTENSQETVSEGDQLEWGNFGLDQPKGEIELILNSGEKHRFAIGQRKNYQGDAYLRKNDESKVLIASSTWFSKIDKTSLEFRDKRLMRRSNAATEKVSFEKGTEKFQLVKKDGQWQMARNPEWKLDQNKVRELISQLNSTEILEFIAEGDAKPEELKKWGLLPGQFRLTVEAAAETKLKPWTADFSFLSDKVARVHVSEPDFVLKLAPSELEKFQILRADSFRDRSEPFHFDKTKVKKIELRLGQKKVELKSEDEKGAQIIGLLEKMTIADFSSSQSARLDQEILLQDEAGKDIFRLKWGGLHTVINAKGSQVSVYSAEVSGYPQPFAIQESDINSLPLNEQNKKESVQ